MECGHCGAINSDRAKFCGKCAVRLRTNAATGPIERPMVVAFEQDTDKTVQLVAEPLQADRDAIPVSNFTSAPLFETTTPPVPQPSGPEPSVSKTHGVRNPFIFGAAALLIAAVGSVGYWYSNDGKASGFGATPTTNSKTPEAIAPAAVATQSVPTAAQSGTVVPTPFLTKAVTGTDAVLNKSAVGPTTALTQTSAKKVEKITVPRATPVKRKSQTASPPKAATSPTKRRDEIGSSNDAAVKNNQADITRPGKSKAPPQAAQQTPQQLCADRSNFISRGICESRECEKPEHLPLKFCVDMRARRAPREYAN